MLPLPPQQNWGQTGQVSAAPIAGTPQPQQTGGAIAADVMKGVSQFVRDYRATQQQFKDQAKQEYENMLQQLA